MKSISPTELIKQIEAAGHCLDDLEKKSRSKVDSDGCFARISVAPGLSVVWKGNPNFQGGKRNGYGPGLYAVGALSRCSSATWLLRQA
jgi:hypothetical protein